MASWTNKNHLCVNIFLKISFLFEEYGSNINHPTQRLVLHYVLHVRTMALECCASHEIWKHVGSEKESALSATQEHKSGLRTLDPVDQTVSRAPSCQPLVRTGKWYGVRLAECQTWLLCRDWEKLRLGGYLHTTSTQVDHTKGTAFVERVTTSLQR